MSGKRPEFRWSRCAYRQRYLAVPQPDGTVGVGIVYTFEAAADRDGDRLKTLWGYNTFLARNDSEFLDELEEDFCSRMDDYEDESVLMREAQVKAEEDMRHLGWLDRYSAMFEEESE